MMTKYCPDGRTALTVRVCPDTLEGLRHAAQDLDCTMQDIILGALLMEYGLHLYSPDALSCRITADDIDRYTARRMRDLSRLVCPLYRPPEWWADHLEDGTLPGLLVDLAAKAIAAVEKIRD